MATVVPPQQTSRAGLITTVVILSVLFILSTVMFFQRDSDLKKTQDEYKGFRERYADAVTEEALKSDDYQKFKEAAKEAKESVFDLQKSQRDELAQLIHGQPLASPLAKERADSLLAAANKEIADRKLGGERKNFADAVSVWPPLYDKVVADTKAVQGQLEAAKDAAAKEVELHKAQLADRETKLGEKDKEIARVTALAADYKSKLDASLLELQSTSAGQIKTLTEQVNQVQAVVATKDQNIAALLKRINDLETWLRRFKANPNPKDDILNVPDGLVTTVTGGDTCYINLGQQDQIAVGMTFQVYDPTKGVARLGDGLATPDAPTRGSKALAAAAAGKGVKQDYQFSLPQGKGSIEVVSVGPGHTSQCKIIHTEPGEAIAQGDLIANLVYDRNIKFNFVIFGDFDLANANSAGGRANDANAVKHLIEQWGGRVQPLPTDPNTPAEHAVNGDVDFVVLGKEPVLPTFSADELGNPTAAATLDRAKHKQDEYRKMVEEAYKYGIPVMNQNRFLYYIGYYDMAKRGTP